MENFLMQDTSQTEIKAEGFTVPKQFHFIAQGIANKDAVVISNNVRFTILTDRCIRCEYSPDQKFEDRPSHAFLFRNQPVPSFTVEKKGETLEIKTNFLHLVCKNTSQPFTSETLSITLFQKNITWKFGTSDTKNLKGTACSLDNRKGAVDLENGLLSRSGYSSIDDSHKPVFNDECWLIERNNHPECKDIYFFGYENDFQNCLQVFCNLSGKIPMVPKFVFGNWWSRYWDYTQDELLRLMSDFEEHQIPLTVCVIDMDWHIVKNPFSDGWSGYSWNEEYFPDPEKFLKTLHNKGLKTSLNLHPNDTIYNYENGYKELAKSLGMDFNSGDPIKFDIADPKFASGYFNHLLHSHEQIGIDFWWIDTGKFASSIPGVDSLTVLNHLHYLDSRQKMIRPITFSRWSELGNHRYPIGFSGDTHITWDSLAFQPYFTSTAANVGFFYWSHDIGGFWKGKEDPELYVRWVQFGTFSPVLRLHSNKCKFSDRRPWGHGLDIEKISSFYLQLRHAMIPYVYSLSYKAHMESLPICKPMYYDHPNDERSYLCEGQYYFGKDLIVAPVSEPLDTITKRARRKVWFPEGDWYHFFTGEYFKGDRFTNYYCSINDTPIFARAGAIIPHTPLSGSNTLENPDQLIVKVFTGASGSFTLFEDDGHTDAFEHGHYCLTELIQNFQNNKTEISIVPIKVDAHLLPSRRKWEFQIFGLNENVSIEAFENDRIVNCSTKYNNQIEVHEISLDFVAVQSEIKIVCTFKTDSQFARRNRIREKLDSILMDANLSNNIKMNIDKKVTEFIEEPKSIAAFTGIMPLSLYETFVNLICDTGYDFVINKYGPQNYCQLWNNSGLENLYYRFISRGSYQSQGSIPKLFTIYEDRISHKELEKPIIWKNETWVMALEYFGTSIPVKPLGMDLADTWSM